MDKKNIIIIIIIIIVGVGGYFILKDNESDPVDVQIETSQKEIDGSTTMKVPANEDGILGGSSDVEEMIVRDEGVVEEDETTSTVEQFVIKYDGSSFSPSTIIIKKGQSVTWVNESSQPMWVASAMHPTHEVYPETSTNDCFGSSFDTCRSFAPDESWSFTFNSAGEWPYHNHLRAVNFGKVIVE